MTSSTFVYCIGGQDYEYALGNDFFLVNNTYFAPLTSQGVGPWTRTTPYPTPIMDESCISKSGAIYCVGGLTAKSNTVSNATEAAYYAFLNPSGITPWMVTTPFIGEGIPSCELDLSYIFCTGNNGTNYFAPISIDGIGRWTQSVSMPSTQNGCALTNTTAYCFDAHPCYDGRDCEAAPVYAPLLASGGTGPWNPTNNTTTWIFGGGSSPNVGLPVILGDYVYDLTNHPAYYAQLSGSFAQGAWNETTEYPYGYPQSCITHTGYILCIGGLELGTHGFFLLWTNEAYFVRVG